VATNSRRSSRSVGKILLSLLYADWLESEGFFGRSGERTIEERSQCRENKFTASKDPES